MEVTQEKRDKGSLIRVSGRMDVVHGPTFEKECQVIIDSGEKRLVVDLAGLEYISSAGLRSILATAKKIKGVGGTIQFCGLAGMVKEVFQVSGFGSMFTVTDTADQAFES